MQEKKQQQQLLQNLGDQIDSSGDKALDQVIRATFKPDFDDREHQVALIKLAYQQEMKIVVAEWPCAAGKSVVLAVYARFLHSKDPTKKIVICVPNILLASLMQLDCKEGLSSDSSGLHKVGVAGLYVCTH